MTGNCWNLVHAESGRTWDNGDCEPHFTTSGDAAEVAQPGWVPRQREQPCLTVACGCGDCTEVLDESGQGYIVHFDNADDAGMVTEWEWTKRPDGTYRCVACSPGGDCECLEALALAAAEQGGQESTR